VSAVTNLLARRLKLLELLESGSSDVQREDIERQLAQIETALELLEWLDTKKDHRET
jgi:hypothetical protein